MNFQQALHQIPATGGGCHTSIMAAANIGILTGNTADEVARAIRAAIPSGGGRKVPDSEIRAAVTKAARECTPDNAPRARRMRYTVPEAPKPTVDGGKLLKAITARGDGATDADLWEESPMRLDGDPSEDWRLVLGQLYCTEDVLFIGDTYGTKVDTVLNHVNRISTSGIIAPFIIPNPFDGQAHDISNGKTSFRCDAAVLDHRFTVIEHDAITELEQVAFWYTVVKERLLDVACLIHSGGKSVHSWVRVNATDAADYRAKVARIRFFLDPMGFDPATKNPARLSRFAGHYRKDKERWQRLLYLNPVERKQTCAIAHKPAPAPTPPKTSQDALQRVAANRPSNDTYLQSYPSAWTDEDYEFFELSQ